MRKREYSKPLDPDFKRFFAEENAKRTPEEVAAARAGPLVDDDLAEKARKYGCVSLCFFICFKLF